MNGIRMTKPMAQYSAYLLLRTFFQFMALLYSQLLDFLVVVLAIEDVPLL